MIDAIFIMSWHQEVIDGRLSGLIDKIYDNIHTIVPVYTFVDKKTLMLPEAMSVVEQLTGAERTRFVYIDDQEYDNPQTTVFYKLLTSMTDTYKQVLLLESDCRLLEDFDRYLNDNIAGIGHDDWWILGSRYYGDAGGEDINHDKNTLRRNHMNGVAVYNRAEQYLNYAKHVFIQQDKINDHHAFDWNFAIEYFKSYTNSNNHLLDTEYIINLSPVWDTHVDYTTRKPRAKIVHQKDIV
jgi:hypothetical protein